jgi:beta-glucosidase
VLDATMLDRIAKKLDFVGIDYYYPVSVGNITQLPATLGAFTGTPWTAALSADGLYYALRHYAHQFPHKPLYVVENGMPTDNGKPRADGYTRSANLRDSIYWLQRARDDGMDVIGYNYWSLTDNYEWGSYRPRFGLYTVNVLKDPKLRRHPTDAVKAYRSITGHRGVPRHYQPTRKPDFCSLVDFLSSCLDPA